MAQEEISEEGSREVNSIMADRTEDYLESLLTDAFKGKGFQKISELLQEKEVKPPQKYSGTLLSQLDKAVRKELDRNEFTNVSLLLKCIQLYFKSDLQEGKSLFVEQGVVEKVLTDSFDLYLVSWFERARGFVTLIDTNENQFLMLLLEDFFDTALVICRCSHEGKKEMVNLFLPVLGHLVTEANVGCALRQEALRTLNSILDSVPREERKKFPLSEEMCSLTKDLAKAILEAGDYDLQVALSEALCRLMTKKWRDDLVHHWFEDNYLAEAFKEIKDREFETDCRKFLNQLNERLGNQRSQTLMLNGSYGICFSSRVYSFPCISAYADMNEVKKPSDEKLEKFWIDFNMGSQCVTFYVDSSEGALWDSVKLTKEAVSSYSLKEDAGEKVVKIYMKVPATLSQTEATKVKITFSAQFDIFSVLKRVLGEEKLMMQMAEEESVQAGKQARQNETGMSVSTDSQGRKDPSISENTDSISENLTSLPSQQLTEPVPKMVDSGITVIPLSQQTDEEDDHQDSANMPKTPSPRMKANPSEKPLEEPMEESTTKKDVTWEKRIRRRSAKQRTEGRKEIYGFENSDSASNEKVAESKGTSLGLKISSQNQRTSELGTKDEVPNHLERKLSNYRKHLFSESNNENTSTSQSEKSWILDSQKQSLPRSRDYTRKRPRVRSKLKVLPVSSASSDSDYQSEKHRTSRRRLQKQMPRKESTLISKDGDLSTVDVAEETLSEELEDGPITIEEPAKGSSREEKAPQQFRDAPAEMSRETESLKWEDSDVLGSTAIKKPKFSGWETSHPSSDTPFKPRKHFDLVEKEAKTQTAQEMHNKVDDASFSKILQEDLSGSGVVAAFESFTSQLKKLFWSRYKNMEISAQNSLRASEKNVSALLNQIHECRLSKLETFQKIVVEEIASLEKETQLLLNMEKDAVDFWNTQLFKLNSFCNQQKQRIQSVDSALGESARSFSDSIQNTPHGQPTKAVESEVFIVPSD